MARFTSSLFAIVLLAASSLITNASNLRTSQAVDATHRDLAQAATTWQQDMLAAVNAERAKVGAPALCMST